MSLQDEWDKAKPIGLEDEWDKATPIQEHKTSVTSFAPPRKAVIAAEGFNKGLANTLGMPVDLLTMGLSAMGSLVGLPPIENPAMGSKWIGDYLPKQTVKPEGFVENIISATGEQVPYAITPILGQAGKGLSTVRNFLQAIRPTVGAGIGVGTAREVLPDSPTAEMAGALVGSTTPMLTRSIMSWMQPQGKRLVESAMKIPPRSVPKEIRDQAIDTIIERDIPFTEKGLSKVSNLLGDVNKEIDDVIKAMPQTKTVTETTKALKQFTPVIEKYPQGAGYQIKTGPNKYIMDHGAPRIFRNEAEAKPLLDDLVSKLPPDQPSTITREIGTIDMNAVSKRIDDLKGFYEKLGPEISKEFLKPLNRLQHKIANQGFITPVEAQEMKKTLYALNRKHYGELKTAQTEGYKAVARGLKEELVKQNPELATLNKNAAELINLEALLEKSLNRVRNYDVIQLGDTIMTTAGGVIGGYPGAVLSATLKKVIEMPRIKVALGKALAKAKQKPIPAPLSRTAIATGATQNVYNGDYND